MRFQAGSDLPWEQRAALAGSWDRRGWQGQKVVVTAGSTCTELSICICTNQDFAELFKINSQLAIPCQVSNTVNNDANKAAKVRSQNALEHPTSKL